MGKKKTDKILRTAHDVGVQWTAATSSVRGVATLLTYLAAAPTQRSVSLGLRILARSETLAGT